MLEILTVSYYADMWLIPINYRKMCDYLDIFLIN